MEVEYHLREREREREWKYQIFFIQNTVSGNCDGFKKEKILKTSGVAEPNYLQYSKKWRWVRYLKKNKSVALNSL